MGDPAIDAGPAVYGGARCVGGVLATGRAPESAVGEGQAVLPLAGPGTLVSALAQTPSSCGSAYGAASHACHRREAGPGEAWISRRSPGGVAAWGHAASPWRR